MKMSEQEKEEMTDWLIAREECVEEDKKYIVKLTNEEYKRVIDVAQEDIKKQFKQKVKDKMEKLNKEIKNSDEIEAIFKIKQQQILQELLEELGV